MSQDNVFKMFCNQCEMSTPGGCGSDAQTIGTCLKEADIACLQDIMLYGLKGLAAYREHAKEMGSDTVEIDDVIAESLYFTMTNVNFDYDDHIAQLMKIGASGVKVMDMLSNGHTSQLGVPTQVTVTQNQAEGKAILVSGHNLDMLKSLLEATTDKGLNIYTHSEMLPAHGYPELRKHPHLKGNIGKAWFDQTKLFESWPGAIVVNTNCIVPKNKNTNYFDRLFTYKVVSVEGATKIEGDDYSGLIEKALSLPEISGFDSSDTLVTGHHYKSVLTLAPKILDAVNNNKIRQFFVIAGCDSPGNSGDYFREVACSLPEDCIIITSSCGKFRFNDIDFGLVPGTEIPRYLDLGQCNDSNGAVHIALALSSAMNIPVNDLPVSIVLSWMEQKAVIILLALFSLGIQDIYLGPKPPQFINKNITDFLTHHFNLHLTGDASEDLKAMLLNKAI
jgi:hydroxylamine reductase